MTDPHIYHDTEKQAFVLLHAWSGTKTEINDDELITQVMNNPKGTNIHEFSRKYQLTYSEATLLLNFVAKRVKSIIGW